MNRILPVLFVLIITSCSTFIDNGIPVLDGADGKKIESPEVIDNIKIELPEIPDMYTLGCVRPGGGSFTVTDFPPLPEKKLPAVPVPSPWAALEERALYQESLKPKSPDSTGRVTPAPAETAKGTEVKHASYSKIPETVPAGNTAIPPAASENKIPEETVTAVAGEKTALTLQGAGWLFMGQSGDEDKEITFLSRLSRQQETVFYFTAQSKGLFILMFEKQDPLSGDRISKRINFRVVESAAEITGIKTEQDSGAVSSVEKVPELNLLLDNGEFDRAFQSYPYQDVMKELLETGIKKGDTERLLIFQDTFSADPEKASVFVTNRETGSLVVDAGKILIKNSLANQGRFLLERVLEKRKSFSGEDEILYILGYTYQHDDQIRDERKAYYYYKKLIDGFPASIYWDSAKREYLFIKRMYIDVR